MGIRKRHSSEYKAKVALAALKEDKTFTELASEYGVHPVQIGLWKKTAAGGMPRIFEEGSRFSTKEKEQKNLISSLYGKIGEVEVENDWLKKKLGL